MGKSNRYRRAKQSQKWIVTAVLVFSSTLFTRATELSKVEANHVVQVILVSAKTYKNPFVEIELNAVVTQPDSNKLRVPMFWAGGKRWCLRYASSVAGVHTFRTECSDNTNAKLHGVEGKIEVMAYTGENPLYRHGPIRVAEDKRHFEHADGTPFLWLGDTWWKNLCKRMTWEGFQELTSDRKAKGFNVVQIVCGPYPDENMMEARWENEGGKPYETKDFSRVNPTYFEYADRRIKHLVDAGIVPVIVGGWGRPQHGGKSTLVQVGLDGFKRHWRNLVARYGAYPTVWMVGGEAKDAYGPWSTLAAYLKDVDPYHHLLCYHAPGHPREMLRDNSMFDFDMVAFGHDGMKTVNRTAQLMQSCLEMSPKRPVLCGEACYEGHMQTNFQDHQRYMFWRFLLSGAAGHTYGAAGIWHGSVEGDPGINPVYDWTTWRQGMNYPGAIQLGLGKRLLETYPWWRFESHPEWAEKDCFAAGIPGEVRFIYQPKRGIYNWKGTIVKHLEPDMSYSVFYFDPVTGRRFDQGTVINKDPMTSSGEYKAPRLPSPQDWVLVLERVKKYDDVTLELADKADMPPSGTQAIVTIDTHAKRQPYSPMIFGGFLEHFGRQVYGGVFEPGSPLADKKGFRLDVIEALKELKVPVIRWPGGCFVDSYHWQKGVGKKRQPYGDPRWGVIESNAFGTHEFIEFCRRVGAEPYICHNSFSSVQEMVDWVAYCNATEGKFAELRKQNGHPEPFNVKFWSVGNEREGQAYIHKVRDGARGMKQVDPSVLVTCSGTHSESRVSPDLLEVAGEHLDYLSVHDYWIRNFQTHQTPDYLSCIMLSEKPQAYINRVCDSLDQAGLRGRIKLAFDEWNLRSWHHPGFQRQEKVDYDDPEIIQLIKARDKSLDPALYTMADALFAASFLNACLRSANDVGMANIAPLVNQTGPLYVHPRGIVRRSHFHAMAMYANELEARVGQLDLEAGNLRHGNRSIPVMDAIATVDQSGKQWAIALVNRHPSENVECTLKMGEMLIDGTYNATVLTGESADSYNDIEHPNRVVPKKTKLTFKKGVVNLSPHSLAIVHVPAQSVEDSTAMDTNTVKQWSAPYRNWHYYPDHVIGAKPNIKGFENVKMTDVPTVFQLPGDKKWYMTFIGFDGKGYQSFIAESDDLVHWTNMRLAMGYGPEGSFDYGGVVLGAYLYKDYNVKAPRTLKKKDGEYFSLYGAYPRQGGYELRPGYEGVASSKDGLTWQRAKDEPILSVHQKDCGAWEKDCIYQPWLVEHKGKYYNFYNAADGHIEQMGLALSDDILEWKRYEHNPVIPNGPKDSYNEKFSSDGKVFWDKDHWVNFFFGVGKGGAHVMVAFSRDLYHWTVDPEPIYKAGGNPSGLDKKYAHKISLVWNPANETYYMYYNAVGNKGRGIGLITSKPLVDVSTKQQGLSYQ